MTEPAADMSIGSLFSGIGGLELGLERAGLGPVVWQAESDPFCRRVLATHWPNAERYEDVRDVDSSAARVGVVCGGFPCQPHSLAGRRRGTADTRWLWPEFARVIGAVRPQWVVVENVLGLRSSGLREVLADLASLGFDAAWRSLAAEDVGAPHRRTRLFLVANANGESERVQPGGSEGESGPEAALARLDGVIWEMAHADRHRTVEPQGDVEVGERKPNAWAAEPDVGRVAHGVPDRMDRLKALGNAVVPHVAEMIGRSILETYCV